MYELIILSLLMGGTVHGYVIAGVINDVIGPFARASNGRLYPLLTKLEEEGATSVHEEATSEGGRVSRTFTITDVGRARFRQLMLDTASTPREYRELFAFKVTAFEHLTRQERVRVLEHYADFARAHVRHLQTQGEDLQRHPEYGHSAAQQARFADVFRHSIGVWRREVEWAVELLAGEDAPRPAASAKKGSRP